MIIQKLANEYINNYIAYKYVVNVDVNDCYNEWCALHTMYIYV